MTICFFTLDDSYDVSQILITISKVDTSVRISSGSLVQIGSSNMVLRTIDSQLLRSNDFVYHNTLENDRKSCSDAYLTQSRHQNIIEVYKFVSFFEIGAHHICHHTQSVLEILRKTVEQQLINLFGVEILRRSKDKCTQVLHALKGKIKYEPITGGINASMFLMVRCLAKWDQ